MRFGGRIQKLVNEYYFLNPNFNDLFHHFQECSVIELGLMDMFRFSNQLLRDVGKSYHIETDFYLTYSRLPSTNLYLPSVS